MSLPVVTDSIQTYLAEVNRYPVLSAREEAEVAQRYYRTNNIDDAHKLVTSNLRYVVRIALEYRNYGCKLSDLIQEGNMGLMVAVKKFNPEKGYRLITYATWWIRAFIQDYILKTRGLVRKGSRALKRKLFYRSAPSGGAEEKAAEDFNVDARELSLDATLADEKTTRMEMLEDESPGSEEIVSGREARGLVKKELTRALARLNERERMVVEKRVMADEPTSLQGIGDELGVTRERVRQIEGQALKKLKKALGPRLGPLALPEGGS